MNIELLGKLGEGLLTADGSKGHPRFESRTVIPAGSSGHGRLLCSAKQPICGQRSDLTSLFRFPEPPLSDRGKDALDPVRRPDVLPVLGREVVEGEQFVTGP
jgi:hypothetical protein